MLEAGIPSRRNRQTTFPKSLSEQLQGQRPNEDLDDAEKAEESRRLELTEKVTASDCRACEQQKLPSRRAGG
jgi:hypothetical protein